MARPKKQSADYFPHFVNSIASDTVFVLEGRYGNDGYAFWFRMLEMLTASDGHFLQLDKTSRWLAFCQKMNVDEGKACKIINLLVDLGQIDRELWFGAKIIWVEGLLINLEPLYKNRRRETPKKPSFYRRNSDQNEVSTYENPQSKVEYSKEEIVVVDRKIGDTREESREEDNDYNNNNNNFYNNSDLDFYDESSERIENNKKQIESIADKPLPKILPFAQEEIGGDDPKFAELKREYQDRIQNGKELSRGTIRDLKELCETVLSTPVLIELVKYAQRTAKNGESCYNHVAKIAGIWRDEGIDSVEKVRKKLDKSNSNNHKKSDEEKEAESLRAKRFEEYARARELPENKIPKGYKPPIPDEKRYQEWLARKQADYEKRWGKSGSVLEQIAEK